MAGDSAFISYVCDQLRPWAAVAPRRMFGGHGLFRADTMFALIHGDTLFLRTDAVNEGGFTAAGMAPFRYQRAGQQVALGYHEVPGDVLEEQERLALWAQKAYEAALRRTKPRPARRRRA